MDSEQTKFPCRSIGKTRHPRTAIGIAVALCPRFRIWQRQTPFKKASRTIAFFYRALHVQHIIISERKCEYKKKANDAYRSRHNFFPKTLRHIHLEDGNEEQIKLRNAVRIRLYL